MWETIRKSDSRSVKKAARTFSTDPLNVTGLHNYASSGLAQSKAVGIKAVQPKGAKAARFVLATKVVALANKPKKSIKTAKMGVRAALGRPRSSPGPLGGGIKALRLRARARRLLLTPLLLSPSPRAAQTGKKAARAARITSFGASKNPTAMYRQDLTAAVASRFSTLKRAEQRRIAKSTRKSVPIKA